MPCHALRAPSAWQKEPDLKVVWAGREKEEGFVAKLLETLGERCGNVLYLGSLDREALYAVLQRAEASVLPSRVDNLPNTAIESFLFSVPVIGSDGASINELVEPGRNGELFPIGDARALADCLVRVWRGETDYARNGFQRPKILDEMTPQRAAEQFLQLAMAEK